MKKTTAFLILAILTFAVPGAYAEQVERVRGEILAVNLSTPSVAIKVLPETGKEDGKPASVMAVAVAPTTRLQGSSLDELRIGDEILADVVKDAEGKGYTAKVIQIDKVNIRYGE